MEAEASPYRAEAWVPQDTFATRLLTMRRELGKTQKEAADACGLDDGSWSNWENGTRPQKLIEVVEAICRTFNVDREWLIWGVQKGQASARKLHIPGEQHLDLCWSQPETDRRFTPRIDRPILSLVHDSATDSDD